MASTTWAWSPSSLQLRLAINSPSIRPQRTSRIKKLCRSPLRLTCLARDDNWNLFSSNSKRRSISNGSSFSVPDSKVDSFSGWSGSDNGGVTPPEPDTDKTKWFTLTGTIVAGVVLLSGLTFASLSLSKKRAFRTKPQMEPLTTQQEFSLVSDDESYKVEEDVNTGNDVGKDDSNLASKTGTDNYLSSETVIDEDPREYKLDNTDEASSINHSNNSTTSENHVVNSSSIPEDLEYESAPLNGSPKLEDGEIVGGSVETEDSEGSPDGSSHEPLSEIEENSVDSEPKNLSDQTNLDHDLLESFPESKGTDDSNISVDSSSGSSPRIPSQLIGDSSVNSQLDTIVDPEVTEPHAETVGFPNAKKDFELSNTQVVLAEENSTSVGMHPLDEKESSGALADAQSAYQFSNIQDTNGHNEMKRVESTIESPSPGTSFYPAGIPAPSVLSAALQVPPGKVLVPAVVDQVQGQALAALQVLKVIEPDVQAGELCTRREYARWLVSASSALSRNTLSKVYPAMYIENVTELAFDDITPEDPDFPSIQGLAEAGLIASKLSNHDLHNEDQGSFFFSPESLLSRQDLVSWKMALEKRQLPTADKKILYERSGFIDINKINQDAWPALVADLSTGDQGIIALAFGCTRLFQPDKPVTKAQACIALATGEASDIVSEELARIEAESMAENAVSAHSALVAEVEKDINASFENELLMEREKINAVEKMAEEARLELERLRAEREESNLALVKERAAIESEMEVLSRLRREVEEQLESLMINKAEISSEKEKISKLRQEAETENQEIGRLQYELEVERKALSMARSWAEDEAKRAREQAKALEEARERWERRGIKVVVDDDLREETAEAVTWLNAGKQFSVDGTVSRAQNLVDQLKIMANNVKGKSREIINLIIQKILCFISVLKEWASNAVRRTGELKDTTLSKARESKQELREAALQFTSSVKESSKRLAGDCREGVEKLTQRFKT